MSPLQRARELVLEHGWNATSYQIVNPGIEHWFASRGDAVVGFVEYAGMRIVAGAPVCAEYRLGEVAAEFEHVTARAGERVCYFGAEARLESVLRGSPGHAQVVLGAQPVWSPQQWPAILAGHASLRAQLNRARNKGVQVSEWPPERAHDHPVLHRCLEEWLATRGLPPLHFLVEPETLSRLWDRRIFVAERHGQIVAFLVASPVPQRRGWLIEQMIRGRGAPNGTTELMLDAAMRATMADSRYITLGLVPLSRRAQVRVAPNPAWLRVTLAWVREHGRRFYNFDGLDAFKAKFDPERWDPVFAISNEPRFSPATLYAIAAAFTQGAPVATVARALGWALRTEARGFFGRG